MSDETRSWHHGLMARWWAEFNHPEPEEVAYYAAAIARFGEPALDLGCGNGRILLPLLRLGLDVDGVDVSADMISFAEAASRAEGFGPSLRVQPTHELDATRTYGTIFMCGVFGIGGRRDRDLEGLRRAFRHLAPGGTLLINHELPYADQDDARWGLWLEGRRDGLPRDWPETGDRRTAADGDELEEAGRLVALEPLAQRRTYEMRIRRWHEDAVVEEERASLDENLYFTQEIVGLLEHVGFDGIEVEGGYTGRPATDDDGIVMFVAHR